MLPGSIGRDGPTPGGRATFGRGVTRLTLDYPPANAFVFGVRIGVVMARAPSVRNTSSKERENFDSLPLITESDVSKPLPHREVSGLLADPGGVRVPRDAEHVDMRGRGLPDPILKGGQIADTGFEQRFRRISPPHVGRSRRDVRFCTTSFCAVSLAVRYAQLNHVWARVLQRSS
jgi:hypothetical protein